MDHPVMRFGENEVAGVPTPHNVERHDARDRRHHRQREAPHGRYDQHPEQVDRTHAFQGCDFFEQVDQGGFARNEARRDHESHRG
jgi:hypothetical protein